jgi:UDP-glucose 4-epimerase
VCLDNLSLGTKDLINHCINKADFEFCEFDICDTKKLNELFEKHSFQRVYHLAANSDIQKGGQDPHIDLHDTLLTTVSLLDAMRLHGVCELLFASSSAVYGDKPGLLSENTGDLRPISYYGASKLASEALISAYTAMNGMSVNVIRFPNVVGPRLTHGVIYDFVGKLRSNPRELQILGDGTQEKPYLHVADLLDAILSMRYHRGVEVFNVGTDSSTTVRRVADIVCEEMALKGVEYKYTGGSIGWPGDVPKFQYDLSKIHATGWKARHVSDEAVREAARATVNERSSA